MSYERDLRDMCVVTILIAWSALSIHSFQAWATPAHASGGGAEPMRAADLREAEREDRVIEGRIVGKPNKKRVVATSLVLPGRAVRPGQTVTLSFSLDMKEGWHVNSARPTLEYLIATLLEFVDTGGIEIEDLAYPEGHMVKLKFSDKTLSVYEGRTTIRPTLRPPRDLSPGLHEVRALLTYQACSDTACLAPETVEYKIPIRVEGEPVAGLEARAEAAPGTVAASGLAEGANPLATQLEERGWLFVLAVVFVGGFFLTLTPCVYPMIPITIGFFGSQVTGGGWGRRVALPALYVLGMCVTYSTLGAAAGLSGGLFGATLQSPWVVGSLVLLFVAMALWMFGAYELRLPGVLTTRFGIGRSGALGASLMGLTMGLVAAPCIGPFIVTLLAFVGALGDPLIGFGLFFCMSLGLGTPFLVLGIFSGALANLPRSGPWMVYAKKVMGVALLGVAIYFLQPFLSDRQIGFLALAFTVAAGLYLAWMERSRMAARWFVPVRVVIGLAVVICGLWISAPLVSSRPEADWRPYSADALAEAKGEGLPIVIDFYAEWCLPCRELDRNTFSDPGVLAELDRFALLKADLTSFESEPVRRLRDEFDVIGVPTIVIIDSQGTEHAGLRLYEYEPPAAFLERLRQVR